MKVKNIAFLFVVSIIVSGCGLFGDSENAKLRKEIEELKKQKQPENGAKNPDGLVGEKQKREVKINSGYLTLRDAPDTKTGKLVAKIPNNAEVTVEGCKEESTTISGRKGSWCRAIYKGKGGWLFNAWLVEPGKKDSKKKSKPVAGRAPKFEDYPVKEAYTGKNAELVMDDFGKQFKSRLEAALKNGKPSFAGKYIVANWGCGSGGCNTGAVIDAETGKAYSFPVSLSSVWVENPNSDGGDDFQDHEYKLNSRLMLFAGNLEGSEHTDGADVIEYYEFKNGKFIFVKSIPYGKKK
ncbi:MAG: hypothetical protein HKN33_02745 [Pyrinomonadaceae bacterium]|nr:hypothetical protein [Pyrinomonadaceae bacterium]